MTKKFKRIRFNPHHGGQIDAQDIRIMVDTINELGSRVDDIEEREEEEKALRDKKPAVKAAWEKISTC